MVDRILQNQHVFRGHRLPGDDNLIREHAHPVFTRFPVTGCEAGGVHQFKKNIFSTPCSFHADIPFLS